MVVEWRVSVVRSVAALSARGRGEGSRRLPRSSSDDVLMVGTDYGTAPCYSPVPNIGLDAGDINERVTLV